MSEQAGTEKRNDDLQEKQINNEDIMKFWQVLLGKFHEGISQLSGEAQDIMLRKQAEATVEIMLMAMGRWTGRDPRTFSVDEMIENHEKIEKQFSEGKASITREGNVITWKSNIPYCYDSKIQQKIIAPYPAYCKNDDFFFELLYQIPHKGPVKVEGLKSILRGDNECITRIELL